jgi:hypothetical protein
MKAFGANPQVGSQNGANNGGVIIIKSINPIAISHNLIIPLSPTPDNYNISIS